MADIAAAIQMEEEALQKLKNQNILKMTSDSTKGISNPNCTYTLINSSKSLSSSKKTEVVQDLISFQDVSVENTIKDELSDFSACDKINSHSKSLYDKSADKSIKDVLALYNTTGGIGVTGIKNMPFNQSPIYQQSSAFSNQWQSDQLFDKSSTQTQSFHGYGVQSDPSYFSLPPYNKSFHLHKYGFGLPYPNSTSIWHKQPDVSAISMQNSQYNFDTRNHKNTALSTGLNTKESSNGNTYTFPRPSSLSQLNNIFAEKNSNVSPSGSTQLDGQNQSFSSQRISVQTDQNGLQRSSSFGSSILINSHPTAQDEKLTNIFDEWLNGGWVNDSSTSSPQQHSLQEEKVAPDWLEWDPLHNSAEITPDFEYRERTKNIFSDADLPGFGSDKNESSIFENNQMSTCMELDESTELKRFGQSLAKLKANFKHEDKISNPGHLISPMTSCQYWSAQDDTVTNEEDANCSVRISVTADGIDEPVTFECNVNASVEHIISQALCIAYEDISSVSIDDFYFKIAGKQEYLISKSKLGLYHYVHECRKFEKDISLELLHNSKVDRSLQRTKLDDDSNSTIPEEFLKRFSKPDTVMSRSSIRILIDAYNKETERFLDTLKQEADMTSIQQSFGRVLQTVKATCSALGNIETYDIEMSCKQVKEVIASTSSTSAISSLSLGRDVISNDSNAKGTSFTSSKYKNVQKGIQNLTEAIIDITELYCKAYQVDAYHQTSPIKNSHNKLSTVSSSVTRELYSAHVLSLHRIPKYWEITFDEFYVSCRLFHGEIPISCISKTDYVKVSKNLYSKVCWNKWVKFDVSVCELPLETTLRVFLFGVQRSEDKITSKNLAWLSIPLFDHQGILKFKGEFFGMWDCSNHSKSGRIEGAFTCNHDILNTESVIIHLGFSGDEFPYNVIQHSNSDSENENKPFNWIYMDDLDRKDRYELESALSHARLTAGPLFNLSSREKEILWKYRNVLFSHNNNISPASNLTVLLHCVPRWSPTLPHAQAAYDLIASWPQPPDPEECLALLTATFPDSRVRSAAVMWLEQAGDAEISLWLPQLVQAVCFEPRHDSQLANMLLRRALGNIRICHQLYWLLYDNMSTPAHLERYVVLHAALVTICGNALRKEFEKERYLLQMIEKVAEKVKETKDTARATILSERLKDVVARVNGHKFRIPTNPSLVSSGISIQNSSYFSSNATPLKLAFINNHTPTSEIYIMYKVGDDLRQDSLTMQLIRVMDRMWLCEGLDLRMVTFDCLPIGPLKGMVEIVPESKTFREIQSSYGLTGAFKDRPIAEWLEKYNPTGLSYERAVENFTLSCAGYCVATYVLGICDRHNDNIMLKSSGHLFHIDFGKFLGHAQMFGNIRRDRAPFVLTSDMAYVINGGVKPSSKFHDFVDVCCLAFNILRKRAHTIINLLSLMLNCGIPELSSKADLKYVYDSLKPNASDTEATIMFTRLIESSLSSSFTRINFFIHNLAQLRFHANESDEDRKILSFSPQIHGYKEVEGIIVSATVVGYQKRYDPEKYYIYCVKVSREKNSSSIDSYVFRTFDEFEELHRKLSYNSTLRLPNFPNSVVVGRSQVKQVAEKRKEKLNVYLRLLLKSPRNVAMHDLVYTFFHPILRDEEKEMNVNVKSPGLTVGGEIKLSLHYKNNALYVMVHHCKNLSPVDETDPDPYVKTYLLPDPSHITKRKTKVARKTLHPTYNEILVYQKPLVEIRNRQLYVSVWNYENLQENDFMGSTIINLSSIDLNNDTSKWYLLKSGSS